jgi:hypothetical protein
VNFPDFQEEAVCKTVDPELWWPEKGGDNSVAKRICVTCPAEAKCLQWALDNGEKEGIWGATSGRERSRMKRQKRHDQGGVRCTVCDCIFKGVPQQMYCSEACSLIARRRRAKRAS